jgi:hypothetical protein
VTAQHAWAVSKDKQSVTAPINHNHHFYLENHIPYQVKLQYMIDEIVVGYEMESVHFHLNMSRIDGIGNSSKQRYAAGRNITAVSKINLLGFSQPVIFEAACSSQKKP